MTISTTYLSPTQFEHFIPDLIKSTWLTTEFGILMPATLLSCIEYEAKKSKTSKEEVKNILNLLQILDNNFLKSRCFLDRLTDLWRYEFGTHIECKNIGKESRGDFMWPPVETLLKSLLTAFRLMNKEKFTSYIKKLIHLKNHREVLAEIWPLLRIDDKTIHIEFDVKKYSPPPKGNNIQSDIDLVVKHQNTTVLIEVKTRTSDLRKMMEQDNKKIEPQHNPRRLFQDLEHKFVDASPDDRLQGVWVNTYVQQPCKKLIEEFDKLNKNKIHFVILGGTTENASILTRREGDKKLLSNLFKLTESNSFIF